MFIAANLVSVGKYSTDTEEGNINREGTERQYTVAITPVAKRNIVDSDWTQKEKRILIRPFNLSQFVMFLSLHKV